MAKELAQTVGGKKIAFLIAILAAFAVLASLGNRLDGATPASAISAFGFDCDDALLGPGDTVTCTVEATTQPGDDPLILQIASPALFDGNGDPVFAALVAANVDCNANLAAITVAAGYPQTTASNAICQYESPAAAAHVEMTVVFTVIGVLSHDAAGAGTDETGDFQGSASDSCVAVAGLCPGGAGFVPADADVDSVQVVGPSITPDKVATVTSATCQAGTCQADYDITFSNAAATPEGDLDDLNFIDELDANLTILSITAGPNYVAGDCTFTNNPPVLDCSSVNGGTEGDIDIPGGSVWGVTVSVQVNSGIPTTPYNVENNIDAVDISADNTDNIPGAGPAIFAVVGVRSLAVTKYADPSSVTSVPIQEFTWLYRIESNGTVDVNDVVLIDNQLSGDGASLEVVPGQTWTGSLAYIDNGPAGPDATDTGCRVGGITVLGPDILECRLTGDGLGQSGGLDPLQAGASVTIAVQMRTVAGAAAGTNVYNDAVVSGDGVPPIQNFGGVVTISNNPILSITKTATPSTVGFSAAEATTFTITVRNSGVAAVPASSIVLTDLLPAGLDSTGTGTCDEPAIFGAGQTIVPILAANDNAAGGPDEFSCTIVAVLEPGTTPAAAATFINQASATYLGVTISAFESVTAITPDIEIEKVATNGFITSAAGSETFTITVRNTGTAASGPVTVVDAPSPGLVVDSVTSVTLGAACDSAAELAAGCVFPTLAAGASEVITVTVSATPGTQSGIILSNTACATQAAPVADGDCDDALTTVRAEDLSITKTGTGNISSVPGSETYTITVTNDGTAAAGAFVITDVAAPGIILDTVSANPANGLTCDTPAELIAGCPFLAGLAPGASVVVTVTAHVDPSVPDGTTLVNTACANPAVDGFATVCASFPVTIEAPGLSISIVPSKAPVSSNPQEYFGWIVVLRNDGIATANGITFTVDTPVNNTFQTMANFSVGGFTCTQTTAVLITCSGGALGPGDSVSVTIGTRVNASLANGATATAEAQVTACTNCPNLPDAAGSVTIQNNPVLSMFKYANSDPVVAGGTATYTVVIENRGGADAVVTVHDAMPAMLTNIQVSSSVSPAAAFNCTANQTTKVVTCTNQTVAAGSVVTLTISGTVPANADDGSVLINNAELTSPLIPQITLTAAAANNIIAATLVVEKQNLPQIVGPNGIVTSTIIVTNHGNATANAVGITDVLPLRATFVAVGSTPSCSVTSTTGSGLTLQQTVTCTGPNLAQGSSTTFTVRFNVGDPFAAPAQSGIRSNTACSTNTSGFPNGCAQASVTVAAIVAGAGLVHVDVDAASESASHGLGATDPNQVLHDPGSSETQPALTDDIDDATGSEHTVCLISPDYGLNDQADIVWSILPTPGSTATVSPAGGVKSIKNIVDLSFNDPEANCISWRSGGVGGQTITASHAITGQVFYAATIAGQTPTPTPLIKEWNDIDSTKIVKILGDVGSPTLFTNTQEAANWMSGSCVRNVDSIPAAGVGTSCLARDNWDQFAYLITGAAIIQGPNAGQLLAGNATFLEYALGGHEGVQGTDYNGPLDGVEQTFTISGTCGSVRVENPVTGNTAILINGTSSTSVTILNSDKGVAFQFLPNNDGSLATTTANANCAAGEYIRITITSTEDVVLRSDVDGAPTEVVEVRFAVAPPPQKQILLAWAGQRIILEHDWRINPAGPNGRAWDVLSSTIPADPALGNTCPITVAAGSNSFPVHYIRGGGPGNFLPSLGAQVLGNDDARVLVGVLTDQANDNNQVFAGNLNCISRVLYESEDPGEVDIEAFIDFEPTDPNFTNYPPQLSKIAFVIYYMKFESIELSIVSQVSKPTHNGGQLDEPLSGDTTTLYDYADWAPGNPWDASLDDADDAVTWNVSKDLLLRGRVKGWTVSSNPSGRAAVNEPGTNNSRPANRWVLPDDWDIMAGGPTGDEVKGTAEETRPDYDLMIAPNNKGIGVLSTQFLCQTPVGDCSELVLNITLAGLPVVPVAVTQSNNVPGPIEGPFSLLDLRGPLSAALSNFVPQTVRNTIIRDGDIDWYDAPMPVALVSVDLRESGFLKQVRKADVYYLGRTNGHWGSCTVTNGSCAAVSAGGGQDFTNPFYIVNVPDSPFIPAVNAGGGFNWDSFAQDGVGGLGQGPYEFWNALPQYLGWSTGGVNTNPNSIADSTVTAAQRLELAQIRAAYCNVYSSLNPQDEACDLFIDSEASRSARSIGRTLVVYSDNHGEFMVAANGDFKLTYADCDTNVFGGGKHCAKDDVVGTSKVTATVDYPDFRGKHFAIKSNTASITWTWGGYKSVTIEDGELDQFKYIVFRAKDRDGYCGLPEGTVSLHPVLSAADAWDTVGANDPIESVDFLIDSGEGIIVATSGGQTGINDGKQFATGVRTYSVATQEILKLAGLSTQVTKWWAPLEGTDECQAWIRVSNSLLGILNVLATAHDDEGDIGFDRIIDFSSTSSYTLTFRWSLITWAGQDGISPTNALKGTVGEDSNDIFDKVTAIYGWNQSSQTWLGFFPAGVSVPGANDLTALENGAAYWIAIKGPDPVTWTIATDID